MSQRRWNPVRRPAMLTRPPSVPGSPIFSLVELPRPLQVQRSPRRMALNQKRLLKTLRLPKCLPSPSSQPDVPQELQRELRLLPLMHLCGSQPAPTVLVDLTSSQRTKRRQNQQQENLSLQQMRKLRLRQVVARGAWSGCGRSSSCCSARPSSSPCTPSAPAMCATLPYQGSPLTPGKASDTIWLISHSITLRFSGITLTMKLLEWFSRLLFFSGCWNSSASEKRLILLELFPEK